jgi:hypothetical protein
MPPDSPQTRFLLRGSVLLVTLLLFWWFVLANASLVVLRDCTEVCWALAFGGDAGKLIIETSAEAWTLRVPMEFTIPASSEQPVPVRIHSIDFDIARPDLLAFTFSLPVYWAILLAAPGIRRHLGPLMVGSILVALLEVSLFLAFAEVSARHAAARWSLQPDNVAQWLLRFSDYLVINVIPYIAPFAIALALHRGLRSQLFRWVMVEPFPGSRNRLAHSQKQRPYNS